MAVAAGVLQGPLVRPTAVGAIGLMQAPWAVLGAKAKVHQGHLVAVPLAAAVEEDVGALDVLVDVAVGVDVFQAVELRKLRE